MSALACSCDEYSAPWLPELIHVQKLDTLKNMTQQKPQTRKVIYSTGDEREAGDVGVTLRLAGHDRSSVLIMSHNIRIKLKLSGIQKYQECIEEVTYAYNENKNK